MSLLEELEEWTYVYICDHCHNSVEVPFKIDNSMTARMTCGDCACDRKFVVSRIIRRSLQSNTPV